MTHRDEECKPCTVVSSDPDGGGYGWENNQTCIVSSGPTLHQQANVRITVDIRGAGTRWSRSRAVWI